MYVGQGIGTAHAALARRLAPDAAAQTGAAAFLAVVPGGVLEHQLLGVAVLPQGPRPRGQAVIKQLVHLEQIPGGRGVVGHDEGLYVGTRHGVLKHQALRHGGYALLPPLQNDDADGLPLRRLLPDHAVQMRLRLVEYQRRQLLLLGADAQQVLTVRLGVAQVHTVHALTLRT